jgi:hypothetical protein
VRNFARMRLGMTAKYGFKPSFNQSFPVDESPTAWWVTHITSASIKSGGADGRELPHRFALGHHAPLLAGVDRLASGRLCGGLVVTVANSAPHEHENRPWLVVRLAPRQSRIHPHGPNGTCFTLHRARSADRNSARRHHDLFLNQPSYEYA